MTNSDWRTKDNISSTKSEEQQTRSVSALRPHPKNDLIYGDRRDLEDSFLVSIADSGIRSPIVIAADGTIISGHRRWEAAKLLEWSEVPVDVREYRSERDRLEALIDFGRHRDKTFRQKMREADELEEIERQKAKSRQGTRTDLRDKLPEGRQIEFGRSRDKIADKIGMGSGRKYAEARKLWEAAKAGDPVAEHEIDCIERGTQSVSRGWKNIRKRHETENDSSSTHGTNRATADEEADENTANDRRRLDSTDLILSAHVGTNADVFAKVLDLHVEPGSIIADVTYGQGAFWRQVSADAYELRATDLNPEKSPSSNEGIDYRDLPYGDSEIDAVVLDPPYASGFYDETRSAAESEFWIKKRYANVTNSDLTYHEAVLHEYAVAGEEAHRVLKPNGVLIAKLQDEVSCNEQRLTHIEVTNIYEEEFGFNTRDLFVVVRRDTPIVSNVKRQRRARKNHSYFMIFER